MNAADDQGAAPARTGRTASGPDQADQTGAEQAGAEQAGAGRTQADLAGPGLLAGYWHRADRAAGGLAADLVLYTLSTVFAAVTAVTSTLLPHRAWGTVAAVGYLVASVAVLGQLLVRRRQPTSRLSGTAGRAGLVAATWAGTALLPLVWQAVDRAGGRLDRAQEEVLVIEHSGARLLDHGTPYLTREAIAALPAGEQLLGYTPYQPGMAIFGLPRAAAGTVWWTDARIWFAVATAVALVAAVRLLRRDTTISTTAGSSATGAGNAGQDSALVRAVQLATVLPVCALTLATGGDDLPVLALCLLALAYAARDRHLAAGLAAALKLFAWPVLLVLLIHTVVRSRRSGRESAATGPAPGPRLTPPGRWFTRPGARFAIGAVGLPVAAIIPAQLVDSAALVENVLRFPLGDGLVSSPAQSPFPGHLIAQALPGGRLVAAALLVAAGLAIAVQLLRRPPRTAATTSLICGYGLLAAILLMPSTRFGYVLYPVAFLAWAHALRLADNTGQVADSPESSLATSAP